MMTGDGEMGDSGDGAMMEDNGDGAMEHRHWIVVDQSCNRRRQQQQQMSWRTMMGSVHSLAGPDW